VAASYGLLSCDSINCSHILDRNHTCLANGGQVAAERLDRYAVVGGQTLDGARGPSRGVMARATGYSVPSPRAGRYRGRWLSLPDSRAS
jgi:hypothetical protein